MGVFSSFRKSIKLKNISRKLGKAIHPTDVRDLLFSGAAKEEALEELVELVFSDRLLSQVVAKHGASANKIKEIYVLLELNGAGEWQRGHYVPVSTLAFGLTLDYVLQNINSQTDSNSALEVAYQLVEYFRLGKIGKVK